MAALGEDLCYTWLVLSDSESSFNHLLDCALYAFIRFTDDDKNAINPSVSWLEVVVPFMLIIQTLMLCRVLITLGVGHILILSAVENVIGKGFRAELYMIRKRMFSR